MIVLISERNPNTKTGWDHWGKCDTCTDQSDITPRASHAVAWCLEHQRRCRLVTGQPVTWKRDGADLGYVTPMLGLDMEIPPGGRI